MAPWPVERRRHVEFSGLIIELPGTGRIMLMRWVEGTTYWAALVDEDDSPGPQQILVTVDLHDLRLWELKWRRYRERLVSIKSAICEAPGSVDLEAGLQAHMASRP